MNHLSGFFEVGQKMLVNVLVARQNLGVKLEKVALTSRAELAEPSSLHIKGIRQWYKRVLQLRK
jgi:hypothetical protein